MDIVNGAIGEDVFGGDDLAIYDQFDGDEAGVIDSSTLDIPVRLFGLGALFEGRIWGWVETGGDASGDIDGGGLGEFEFASVFAHEDRIHLEIHEVTFAVADVVFSFADPFAPLVVVELAWEFDVRSAEADLFAVDAGEIGFAADAGFEAAVESMVPDVEFPDVGGIDGGDEVYRWDELTGGAWDFVGDIDDVFIRSDTIEGGGFEVREGGAFDFEAPA